MITKDVCADRHLPSSLLPTTAKTASKLLALSDIFSSQGYRPLELSLETQLRLFKALMEAISIKKWESQEVLQHEVQRFFGQRARHSARKDAEARRMKYAAKAEKKKQQAAEKAEKV